MDPQENYIVISMNCINENLDFEKIRAEYQSNNNFVVIRDFLQTETAEELHSYYHNIPEEWWSWMFLPDPDLGLENWKTNVYKNTDDPNTKNLINLKRKAVNKAFSENQGFSYIYRRVFYDSHYEECRCEECVFQKDFLTQKPMLSFLENLTGHENLTAGELFASRLEKGDYNGPHNDIGKGRVTIVLSLTKNWLPQDGGVFFGMEEDYCTIKHVEVPTFNSLVVFDVSDGGMPHLVNHVENHDKKRISITGWYE